MSNYMKSASLFLMLCLAESVSAQTSCTTHEVFVDAGNRCVDIKTDDVIVLGTLKVETGKDGKPLVILHDDSRGDIELLLTPSLVEAVDESPAESFEVEGHLSNGELTVKNLRPIE
ncbi:MAG: hypothetical protein H7318_10850 [Oligoflexus sp.]|nr:hypothetical protein [Oligoflexus sp.]